MVDYSMTKRELEMLNKDRPDEKYDWLAYEKSPYLQQHKTNPVNWCLGVLPHFKKPNGRVKVSFCP